jgi:hypothetical protein
MKALKVAGIVLGVLLIVAGVVRACMLWDRARDKMPELTEVPEGRRAPAGSSTLFGLVVGESRMGAVDALGLAGCRNTSMRALMQKKRDAIKDAMKQAEARGDDPDGVTGASLANYRSRKEQNPQVRISCEPVAGAVFSDRQRGPETGRLLVVLDSAEHPVRHVSFARKIDEPMRALDEWNGAVAEMTKRFGEPTSTMNGEPAFQVPPFPRMKLFKNEWTFTDLRAEVTAMSFGARGIDVKEALEVPWPVRVDAR